MTAEATPTTAEQPPFPLSGLDTGFGGDASATVLPFSLRQVLFLAAVTVLGAWLRLWHLGDWSIWVDEAHTWRDVTMPIERFFGEVRNWYPTSFLFLRYLLEHGWLENSEGWLRLPFAFCGIVTVPLLALFGNLIVGRRAALMAALFLAVNPWHIYWSQNARAYVLVCMFAVAAAGTWWLGIARRSPGWLATGLVLTMVSGTCHSTGLLLLPVFLAYALLAGRTVSRRRAWIAAFALGIGLTAVPSIIDWLPPVKAFLGAKPGSRPSLVHLLQTTAFYFRLPLLGAAVIGVAMLFQQRLQGRMLYLACWALLPLLLLGIVGATTVKVTARYGLAAMPAVLLLAGAASVRVGELLSASFARGAHWSGLMARVALPSILLLDMVAYDYMYFAVQYGDRGRWQEACRYVARHGGVVADVLTTHEPVVQYYLRPDYYRGDEFALAGDRPSVFSIEEDRIRDSGTDGRPGDGATFLQQHVQIALERHSSLYVLVALPELREKDGDGSLRRALREHFELVEVLPCWVGPKDESIYVYTPRRSG